METTVTQHVENFETLRRAFECREVALMECQVTATGEKVATICAVSYDGENYTFTPFATFLNGNPYELLNPPNPDGGFFPGECQQEREDLDAEERRNVVNGQVHP